jgi:predicted transcriptional regulator
MEDNTAKKPLFDGRTTIPTTSENFARTWLEVMRPFHKLTAREMDFAAAMLNKRHELAETIADQGNNDKILFNDETKESLRNEIGISRAYMQGILHKMRECGMITGRRFEPKFLPEWKKGKPFRTLFIFTNEA